MSAREETGRILQEISAAQDRDEVVNICARFDGLAATLSPRTRKRVREQLADLIRECGLHPPGHDTEESAYGDA